MQVDNKLAIPTYSPPSPTIAKSKYFIYKKKNSNAILATFKACLVKKSCFVLNFDKSHFC